MLSSKWLMSPSVFRKDHEKAEFEVHEVYAIDVLISTGEGKVRHCARLQSPWHTDRRAEPFSLWLTSPGQGRRAANHHLQARPHQAVWAEDEDISRVLQRGGAPVRRHALHSPVRSPHHYSFRSTALSPAPKISLDLPLLLHLPPPGRLRMRARPGWVWWSAPNTSFCSLLTCSMRRKVRCTAVAIRGSRLIAGGNVTSNTHCFSLKLKHRSLKCGVSLFKTARSVLQVIINRAFPSRVTSQPVHCVLGWIISFMGLLSAAQ